MTDRKGASVDAGTMNFVGARSSGPNVSFTSVRNAFLDLPIEHKRILRLSKTSFVELAGRLVVVGDEALQTANLLNKDARRPMAGGVISAGELDAQQIIALILKRVLGPPQNKGEKCCYSVPAASVDVQGSDVTYHSAILRKVIEELGYDPEPANEALAVVLSECLKENFSGIGISYGSGMTNVCLSYNAMSSFEFSLGRGGDWIDQLSAKAVGTTAARICSIKESASDLTKPQSREEEAVSFHVQSLIDYTIDKFVEAFSQKRSEIHIPGAIPIIVSGGTSKAGGFLDKFKERFEAKRGSFPLKVSEIRAAVDPMTAVAKGLLVLAQSDSEDDDIDLG